MPFLGFDCSGNNAATTVTAALNTSSNKFCIAKATEGLRANSARYGPTRTEVYTHPGMLFGAYHFAWLNQDPVSEANHFIAYSALNPGEVGVLDVEDWGETDPTKPNYAADKAMRDATTWSMRVTYILSFSDRYRLIMGVRPVIYLNLYWAGQLHAAATPAQWTALCQHTLFLAHYTGTPGQYTAPPAPWVPSLHQYSNKVPYAGAVLDGDWFAYDLPTWNSIAIPQKEPFTMAQYDDIMAAIKAVQTTADKNATDIAAVKASLANAPTKSDLTALQLELDGAISSSSKDLQTSVAGLPDKITPAVTTAVDGQVKDSLGGFTVQLGFPKG